MKTSNWKFQVEICFLKNVGNNIKYKENMKLYVFDLFIYKNIPND